MRILKSNENIWRWLSSNNNWKLIGVMQRCPRKASFSTIHRDIDVLLRCWSSLLECNIYLDTTFEDTMYQTNQYFSPPTKESQIPWLGAAIGFLIGIALVMVDFMAYRTRGYIAHPILKILVIIVSSTIFYFIGQWYGLVF